MNQQKNGFPRGHALAFPAYHYGTVQYSSRPLRHAAVASRAGEEEVERLEKCVCARAGVSPRPGAT